MICLEAIKKASEGWENNEPFPHCVVDGFFDESLARKLESEFPPFNSDVWYQYESPLEVKRACNNWNLFPENTYQVFTLFNSNHFVNFLADCFFGGKKLYADHGLNGGGWHAHGKGGKLNTHLDYSMHPKLHLQRKMNIIVYLNASWQPGWGGELGFWGSESSDFPGRLIKSIEPKFNRAVIFDTTCNSWHGLPDALACPDDHFRRSLAVYYLAEPVENADARGKALFAPSELQKDDNKIIELIRLRASSATASQVYKEG